MAGYFLDRFGESAIQSLIANPANGLEGIEHVLDQIEAIDPMTGRPIRADDVFIDWVVASFLKDGEVGDGRYTYHIFDDAPKADATETIYVCPKEPIIRDVHQSGRMLLHGVKLLYLVDSFAKTAESRSKFL